jgi:hypothetical protein
MREKETTCYIRTVVCSKCGREFIPAPMHRFVEERVSRKTTRKHWYCKWSCYNHRDDEEV